MRGGILCRIWQHAYGRSSLWRLPMVMLNALLCRKEEVHPKSQFKQELVFRLKWKCWRYDWKNETLSSIMPQNVKIAELTICEQSCGTNGTCNSWSEHADVRAREFISIQSWHYFSVVDETAFWINSRQWKQCFSYRIVHRTRPYSVHIAYIWLIRPELSFHQCYTKNRIISFTPSTVYASSDCSRHTVYAMYAATATRITLYT